MIEITRSLARKLVAVLQKSVWATSGRKRIPPVLFRAGPEGLAVSSQYEGLAVRYTQRGRHRGDILTVPGHVLEVFAGEGKGLVRLQRTREDRGLATWDANGRAHEQEFASPDADGLGAFPECPEDILQPVEDHFLSAFHDATSCVGSINYRFAVTLIQLRGDGTIVSTDSRQLLWQEGFPFPWDEDVLVPPARVFGSRVFQGKPVAVGRTATHVVVRCDDWTVALPIGVGLKFPNAEDIITNPPTNSTRWHVPSDEAAFLIQHLPRMPFAEDCPAVTIDLSRPVRLRSRDEDSGRGMELVLQRSAVAGPPVQINNDPRLLLRALKLGFRTFDLVPGNDRVPAKPAHSREGRRHYVWMPLESPPPLLPSDNDERISSSERPRRSR
jgi:hypothetical protein